MLKSFLENMGEGRLVLEKIKMIHFNADDIGKKSMLSLTQVQACSAKMCIVTDRANQGHTPVHCWFDPW